MPFGPRIPSASAIVLLIAGVVLLYLTQEVESGDEDGRGGEAKRVSALVTRVVDGDTAEMEIAGEGEKDVRFIGVDTPESVAPGQPLECFGRQASDFTSDLIEGERVQLLFGAERRDQYGRILAYVYVDGKFVNAELLKLGYARTIEIAPNTDFADRFARLQQSAANAGRGLWGAC